MTIPFSPLEKLNLKFNLQKCIFEPQPKHDNSQVDIWAIFVCFSKYQSKKTTSLIITLNLSDF